MPIPGRMALKQEDGVLTVERPTDRGEDRALHGLTRTLVANMVEDGKTPMLIATDDMREKLTASKARFLAEAWKAAYKKARTLGWLAS